MTDSESQNKLLKFLGFVLLLAVLAFVFIYNYKQQVKDYQLPLFIESLSIQGENGFIEIGELPPSVRIELISILKTIKKSRSSFDIIGGFKKPIKISLLGGNTVYEVSSNEIKMSLPLFLVEDQARIALVKSFLKQHIKKPLDSQFLLTLFSDLIFLYQENKTSLMQAVSNKLLKFDRKLPWIQELAPIEVVCEKQIYPLEYINFCESVNKLSRDKDTQMVTNTWSLLSLRGYLGEMFLDYLNLWSWSDQPDVIKKMVEKLAKFNNDLVQYELPNENVYSEIQAQELIESLVKHFLSVDVDSSIPTDKSKLIYNRLKRNRKASTLLIDLGPGSKIFEFDGAKKSLVSFLVESELFAFIREGNYIEILPHGSRMKLQLEGKESKYHIYDSCHWPLSDDLAGIDLQGEFFIWVKQCSTKQFIEFRAFRANDVLFSFTKRNPQLDFIFFDSKLLKNTFSSKMKNFRLKFFLKADTKIPSNLDIKLGFKHLVWYPGLKFYYSSNPATSIRGIRNGSSPALPSFQSP